MRLAPGFKDKVEKMAGQMADHLRARGWVCDRWIYEGPLLKEPEFPIHVPRPYVSPSPRTG